MRQRKLPVPTFHPIGHHHGGQAMSCLRKILLIKPISAISANITSTDCYDLSFRCFDSIFFNYRVIILASLQQLQPLLLHILREYGPLLAQLPYHKRILRKKFATSELTGPALTSNQIEITG